MSCLRIKLPQAKKAWKSFTSKLQTRLHKFPKYKTIKKPNNNPLQIAVSKTTRPFPSHFMGKYLLPKKRRRVLPFGYQRYYVPKTNAAIAPIYIDNIFKEAPLTQLMGYIPQQTLEKSKKLVVEATADAETSDAREKQEDDTCDVRSSDAREKQEDDTCDVRSIELSSPMPNEIDARAEVKNSIFVCLRRVRSLFV